MSRFKDKNRLKVLKNEVTCLKAKTALFTRNAALLIYINRCNWYLSLSFKELSLFLCLVYDLYLYGTLYWN